MVAGINLSLTHLFMIAFTITSFVVLSLMYINITSAAGSTYTGIVGENLAHAINLAHAAPPDRDTFLLLTQTKGTFVVNFPEDVNGEERKGALVIESYDYSTSSTKKTTYTAYIFKDIKISVDNDIKADKNIQVCQPGSIQYQTSLINSKGVCALNMIKFDRGGPCYCPTCVKEGVCRSLENVTDSAFIFSEKICIKKLRLAPTTIHIYSPKEGKC